MSGRVGAGDLPTAVAPLTYIDDRREHKRILRETQQRTREPSEEEKLEEEEEEDIKMKIKTKKNNNSTMGGKTKKIVGSVNDYLDRRSRASFAAENDSNVPQVPLTERGFKYAFLDPNHPMTNGGLLGLLSGGMLSPDLANRTSGTAREERRLQEEYAQRVCETRAQQGPTPEEIERQLKCVDRDYLLALRQVNDSRELGGERRIKKVG